MKDLKSLIDEANDEGFFVNNIFQHNDGAWQANLRSDDHNAIFAEFGKADTVEGALEQALNRARRLVRGESAPAVSDDLDLFA